jgi:GTPase KRas protein
MQCVIGSGGVGKSCLTVRFLKDEFTSEYDPTVEENYRKTVTIDGVAAVMNIVDTAGQVDNDRNYNSSKSFLRLETNI